MPRPACVRGITPRSVLAEQRLDEPFRVKVLQIPDRLADADVAQRQMEGFADREHDAALGRPVELGQGDARDAERLVEEPRLGDGVLTGGRVKDEQHLVRGLGEPLGDRALDLLDLLHEVDLRVQAPGGVDDDDVHVPGQRRLDRIVGHRGRVRAVAMPHQCGPRAVGPDGELVHGGRPEGVPRRDHDALARSRITRRELADGGGLAHAVHTHHHHDLRRGTRRGCGRSVAGEDRPHLVAQRFLEFVRVRGLGRGDALDQLGCCLHPDVGRDQQLLEIFEDLRVDPALAGDDARKPAREAVACFGQALLEAPENPGPRPRLVIRRLARWRQRGFDRRGRRFLRRAAFGLSGGGLGFTRPFLRWRRGRVLPAPEPGRAAFLGGRRRDFRTGQFRRWRLRQRRPGRRGRLRIPSLGRRRGWRGFGPGRHVVRRRRRGILFFAPEPAQGVLLPQTIQAVPGDYRPACSAAAPL